MKFFFLLLISFSLQAKLVIISHDRTQSFNYQMDQSHIGTSVGELTIKVLDQLAIDYQGNERGIHSILNSPLGNDALVIISAQEMKAYGWCYQVNGVTPELFPHEILIEDENDEILWFWGYAHYLNGDWIAQCAK